MVIGSAFDIVGMVHLSHIPPSPKSKGVEYVINQAKMDIIALQNGGVNAILIENWENDVGTPFISTDMKIIMLKIVQALVPYIKVPVGINILPNDYRAAFEIAGKLGLSFVQLDVFTDSVQTDYKYSQVSPFIIDPDFYEIQEIRKTCPKIKLYASVHPKHYILRCPRPLSESVVKAVRAGADVIVITGSETGKPPSEIDLKIATANAPCVYIGSGLNAGNAAQLVPLARGAIVGTSVKSKDFSVVETERVVRLMQTIQTMH